MGFFVKAEKNVNIYVEDINPEGAKTLLFIHGWPLNHNQYEYQYNVLPGVGYRCVGLDWRGYGESDRPYHGYNFDRMADDVRAVVDTLQLKNVVLIGHSTGGAIAIRYMARHQGYGVCKLVLIDSVGPDSVPKEVANTFITNGLNDRPKMLRDVADMFFFQYQSGPMTEWFCQLGLVAAGYSTAAVMAMLRDESVRKDLSAIHVPTLIVHGIHDKVVPFSQAEETHKLIPNSQLVPFEYSGHGSFIDEKEKLNQVLIKFIGEQ